MRRIMFLYCLGVEVLPYYKFTIIKITEHLTFSKTVEIVDDTFPKGERYVCYFDDFENLKFYKSVTKSEIEHLYMNESILEITDEINKEYPQNRGGAVDIVTLINLVLQKLGVKFSEYTIGGHQTKTINAVTFIRLKTVYLQKFKNLKS